MYHAKKKQELENSRKEQCDFDKNAVLTLQKPDKTRALSKILKRTG